jgi:hypothetical protein
MSTEDIRGVAMVEAELESRIEALSWKITMLKARPASSAIPLNGTTAEFCEDHWQPVIDKVNSHSLIDAYRLFWAGFQGQLALRLQMPDLRDKADRLYVDTLLRNVEESIHERVEAAITDEYADVLIEIQQARDTVGTMREHFQESANSFRSELTRFKKRLLEDDHGAGAAGARRQGGATLVPLPPRSTLSAPHADPAVAGVRRKGLVKRQRPFVPKRLGIVIGQPINHLSPRAWSSQVINHKSSRYLLPF